MHEESVVMVYVSVAYVLLHIAYERRVDSKKWRLQTCGLL
jgi:hypothetical protein